MFIGFISYAFVMVIENMASPIIEGNTTALPNLCLIPLFPIACQPVSFTRPPFMHIFIRNPPSIGVYSFPFLQPVITKM